MKLITAIIRPFKLDDVRYTAASIGIQGLTVSEVHGVGAQYVRPHLYRGAQYPIDSVARTKVELAVDDSLAEQLIEAITNIARTGRQGDGKVFVTELREALRIRTGETGCAAL